MREKHIAAAIVADRLGRFLVTWNERWNCDAFPMTDAASDRAILPSTAIQALEHDLGQRLPNVVAQPLGYVGKFGQSGSSGDDTLYEYWAYEVPADAVESLPSSSKPTRWLSYDDLIADPDVGWSTKEIARSFVENQNVAVAVLTRLGAVETEYLLVWNGNYGGFFFPTTRIKDELKPDAAARKAIRSDLDYPAEIAAQYLGDVPDAHFSRRYNRDRAFRFQICRTSLPSLDLNQPLNLLERGMKARGLAWVWYTAEQLQNPAAPVSPTLPAIRATVLQLIPPTTRQNARRQSEGALALIRRTVAGQTEWLAQWNEKWKAFSLIGGHRHPPESFRDCVIRETTEELNLERDADFTVARDTQSELNYVAFSLSAGEDTAYTMKLFEVELLGDKTLKKIDTDPKNRWLTETEIRRQEAFDGRPVSVSVPMLLSKASLINL